MMLLRDGDSDVLRVMVRGYPVSSNGGVWWALIPCLRTPRGEKVLSPGRRRPFEKSVLHVRAAQRLDD